MAEQRNHLGHLSFVDFAAAARCRTLAALLLVHQIVLCSSATPQSNSVDVICNFFESSSRYVEQPLADVTILL